MTKREQIIEDVIKRANVGVLKKLDTPTLKPSAAVLKPVESSVLKPKTTTLQPSDTPVLKPASAVMKPANNVLIPDNENQEATVIDIASLIPIDTDEKDDLKAQNSEEEE